MKTATVCGMTIQRLEPIVLSDLATSLHDNGYEAVNVVFAMGTDDEQSVSYSIEQFMLIAAVSFVDTF